MNFVPSLSFERQSFDNIKSATTIIDAHDLFSFLFLFSVTFTNIHANFKTVFTFEVLQSFFYYMAQVLLQSSLIIYL